MLKEIKHCLLIPLIQFKRDLESVVAAVASGKSSGKYKSKHPFNPIQIKDGMIVRLRKDGTVKAVLGKYGEYNKKNKG